MLYIRSFNRFILISLALLGLSVSSVNAATPNVDGDGILLGASEVDIGGVLYDVEFVDGSCIDLFDGCDSLLDFDFNTQENAENAAQALLNQVFVDGPLGNFDSIPKLTNGCPGRFGGGGNQVCTVETPFGFHSTNSDWFLGARAVNWAPPDVDNVNSNFTTKLVELGSVATYAKWTLSAVPIPLCDIQMNQATYIDGDTVTADIFRIANLTSAPIAVEWKVWLGVPGIPPISIINLGADSSFVLPAGTDIDLGPLPLLPVTAALPGGSYELSCRLLDPVTGELLAEDLNVIEIQTPNTYYDIGDTGPAGGVVFYVTDGGLHGLEVAPGDQSSAAPWGCSDTEIVGADGTAIGTGAQNTADILAGCPEAGIAARLASDFSLNGYNDWFLPSLDEHYELYLNKEVVGGLVRPFYWSSSEYTGFQAWIQTFGVGGDQGWGEKQISGAVRVVRAF